LLFSQNSDPVVSLVATKYKNRAANVFLDGDTSTETYYLFILYVR